jgi:hypothetical protein
MLTAGTIAQVIAPPHCAEVTTIVGLVSTNPVVVSTLTNGQPRLVFRTDLAHPRRRGRGSASP